MNIRDGGESTSPPKLEVKRPEGELIEPSTVSALPDTNIESGPIDYQEGEMVEVWTNEDHTARKVGKIIQKDGNQYLIAPMINGKIVEDQEVEFTFSDPTRQKRTHFTAEDIRTRVDVKGITFVGAEEKLEGAEKKD